MSYLLVLPVQSMAWDLFSIVHLANTKLIKLSVTVSLGME